MRTLFAISLLCSFCVLPLCAESPDLCGIAHVAFRVSDLDKSLGFYEKLGFEQSFVFKDDTGKVTQAFIKILKRLAADSIEYAELLNPLSN